ncbi:hypothetical protein OH77DRAFT_369572 [Trametes cingulata]|nr:hypothetical protein OH77DRAFT_369572 [Trametes cingulata]
MSAQSSAHTAPSSCPSDVCPEGGAAKDWEKCAQVIQRHSDQLVQRWKEEIDMLLVFAGLFSAVLTAFNVESYQLLLPDGEDDITAALRTIASQLNSFTYQPPFVNSTSPFFGDVQPAGKAGFIPPQHAVWLNTLWFTALISTLSASSIAIMVRQWLHQYNTGLWGHSQEIARLRQYRYENLLRWGVPQIVNMLPILVQLALVLFLSGLLVLLWSLHIAVAIVASITVGILLAFVAATAILPSIRSNCPYQGPHALLFFLLVQSLGSLCRRLLLHIASLADTVQAQLHTTFRPACRRVKRRSLTSLARRRVDDWGLFKSWEARETSILFLISHRMDFNMLNRAYLITLDHALLEHVLPRCLDELDPLRTVRACVDTLLGHTDVEQLFTAPPLAWQRDSPAARKRRALGPRDAVFTGHLLTQALRLLPRCLNAIGEPAMDHESSSKLMWDLLSLLPPRMMRNGYAMWYAREPLISDFLLLRALATLVSIRMASADAFSKLIANVATIDGYDDGYRLRRLELEDLRVVVTAFPKNSEAFQQAMNWDHPVIYENYFESVAALMHILQTSANVPGEHNGPANVLLLRDVLSSVEAFLTHPAWKASSLRQRCAMRALCPSEAESDPTAYHPTFLPMLLRLYRAEPTREVVTSTLVELLREARTLLHRDLTTGIPYDPEESSDAGLWWGRYEALTQAIGVLEATSGSSSPIQRTICGIGESASPAASAPLPLSGT